MKAARLAIASLAVLGALLGASSAASAASPPAWMLSATPLPANIAPGGEGAVFVLATNVGGGDTSAPSFIEATLPVGLDPLEVKSPEGTCSFSGQIATCESSNPVQTGDTFQAVVLFHAQAGLGGPQEVDATVTGGGATDAATTTSVPVQAGPLSFRFLPGVEAPFTEEDGAASTLAGSHPSQQSVFFQFPTQLSGHNLTGSGHVRDIHVDLPPGLIGDPSATETLCTEAQLESGHCPNASALGLIAITATLSPSEVGFGHTGLYNMVPPPGYPAEIAADVAGEGLYLHLLPSVRSDGDYGISVDIPDILALSKQPVFGSLTQIWGDPSSPLHENARGNCENTGGACPVEPQETPFWTMPAHCDGQPFQTELSADSWEEPGVFEHASYDSADLGGNPVSVTDCGALQFEPTIDVTPTTNLTDSSSGLDATLHQPQNPNKAARATPPLRDATVTLPPGMTVNPAQADGLGACSADQIGLLSAVGASPVHISKNPNTCPDASKLGSVEVTTPLLSQRDADHRLELDPETGNPLPRALHGAVYLAKPYANPFGSLLAVYLTVEDPISGTVAKLAGEIKADPKTGQLTTTFKENPQLPIEDIRLHLFEGARASLITPPNCATHTTKTDLVPWSSPDTPDANPESAFQTTAAPGGGPCPSSEAALPNSPTFSAGTIGRKAGAYSPFSLKVSRADGTQRLTKIDTLLPPGLAARFAGVGECSEAQIARATSRSNPEEGILERNDPSCPASSLLGTATVGAGAGPTPYYTKGNVYLAGPYKSAPFSLAIITPAIAGPFDLGTVVVRTALQVDTQTAQGHAVSDPLPSILDGIPLDIRSVAINLDRPGFTLNPTSCDPLAITGSATSVFGQLASFTEPFQVGECGKLPFKPKLSLTLKGKTKRTSHPRLLANLTAKPGEANIARAQVKLPKAAFLDNANINTICTRVQFSADACPPGSIYGKASATTPLLDSPLTGSVYLRSSTHQLPDLVAKLKGPDSQPIEIDLAGRTDSVKGALRNTFEAVPDAPVSKFHLELFGGKRGLIILSSGLCANPDANVQLDGQNAKTYDSAPVVRTSCPKKHKKKGGGGAKHHRGGGAR